MKIKQETVGDWISSYHVNHQTLGFKPTNMGGGLRQDNLRVNQQTCGGWGFLQCKFINSPSSKQTPIIVHRYQFGCIPHVFTMYFPYIPRETHQICTKSPKSPLRARIPIWCWTSCHQNMTPGCKPWRRLSAWRLPGWIYSVWVDLSCDIYIWMFVCMYVSM